MSHCKSTEFISLFPIEIDRVLFGSWLSGFSAGESSFVLSSSQSKRGFVQNAAIFSIALRADDTPILRLIQSYFYCGRLRHYQFKKGKLVCQYTVKNIRHLRNIVIPYFDTFPMYCAKKQSDFIIFKEAVILMHEVTTRKKIFIGSQKGQGTLSKWTQDEISRFHKLKQDITQIRKYDDSLCYT